MHTREKWKYGGRRNLDPNTMRAHTTHVVIADHVNGPWEAIHCKTQEQAVLCAAAPELLSLCKELLEKSWAAPLAAASRAKDLIAEIEGEV